MKRYLFLYNQEKKEKMTIENNDSIIAPKTYRRSEHTIDLREGTYYIVRINLKGFMEVMHAFKTLEEAQKEFDKIGSKPKKEKIV